MPLSAKGNYSMNPQRAAQMDAEEPGKISAADAGYEDPADHCETCRFFVKDGEPCQQVTEPVNATGWCKLYQEGAAEQAKEGELGEQAEEEGNGTGGSVSPAVLNA